MKKSHIVIISISIFTVLITIYSDLVFKVGFYSMKNTIMNIIPSLFPYMVISTLIVSSGAADFLGKLFPISRLFSLPTCASAPIIIGALCGFPLGAKSAAELYEQGYLSKTETEILISIANNTGPSFLVFVVGATLWHDIYFGIFLYITQIITSIFSAYLINKIIFKISSKTHNLYFSISPKGFTESLSKAVTSASLSCVYICGFITFFSVANTIFKELLKNLPENMLLILTAILEFSEATAITANIQSTYAYFICGFSVGWSGLCVFCQTAGFTSSLGLSLKRCVVSKLLQGILLGSACILYKIISINSIEAECFALTEPTNLSTAIYVCPVLAILCLISYIKKHKGA